MKNLTVFLSILILAVFALCSKSLYSSCEAPCGLYDDDGHFDELQGQIATVDKALTEMAKLEKDVSANYHQLSRWVLIKEEQCEGFQQILAKYFLCQRVKPASSAKQEAFDRYNRQLRLLHEMMLAATKCKQEKSRKPLDAMKELLREFRKSYEEGLKE